MWGGPIRRCSNIDDEVWGILENITEITKTTLLLQELVC